ncbi:MAG: hypothetical protein DI551_10620 [Micavibrio aeruginosavorus]|uniref:Uncharacterized protein n=1 Tax=Micavibrio aeruginosavorus TaxID=349221 RepID=A0A2W5PYQ2_9BACT|nr:MAG: hypothetical protein DI551_10620 [Micavibrio aeruginosavorus]
MKYTVIENGQETASFNEDCLVKMAMDSAMLKGMNSLSMDGGKHVTEVRFNEDRKFLKISFEIGNFEN